MQFPQDLKSELPIQPILGEMGMNCSIDVLRIDLLDDESIGNKWFKLKFNLIEVKKQKKQGILTFGGAYSNHLSAVASICYQRNLKSIGIVRGEETLPLNDTLSYCKNNGMEIRYISRSMYKMRNHPDFLEQIQNEYKDYHVVPEGGSNDKGIRGAGQMTKFIPGDKYEFICLPVGSGGTMAGLINAELKARIVGFSSLKGGEYMEDEIKKMLNNSRENWELIHNYHCGGFAKVTDELLDFMKDFFLMYDIKLDPVYTSKMMFGLLDLNRLGYFPAYSKLLAIHTGGLQGIAGMEERLGKKIY